MHAKKQGMREALMPRSRDEKQDAETGVRAYRRGWYELGEERKQEKM